MISFKEFRREPIRIDYLDEKLKSLDKHAIAKKQPLYFLPNSVEEQWLPEKKGELSTCKYASHIYKPVMHGILRCGAKVTVVIHNAIPYMELICPRGKTLDEYEEEIRDKVGEYNADDNNKMSKVTVLSYGHILDELTLREYNDRQNYLVLKFKSVSHRSNALKFFDSINELSMHNDNAYNCYHNIVSREQQVPLTAWQVLKKYRRENVKTKTEKKESYFATSMVFHVDIKDWGALDTDDMNNIWIKNTNEIVMSWDIETCENDLYKRNSGGVPMPDSKTADMFLICCNFSFRNSDLYPNNADPTDEKYIPIKPDRYLCHYAFTTCPSLELPNRTIVLCKSEKEMIKGFAYMFSLLNPDYIADFNGSNYDWLWIVRRAHRFNLIPYMERHMSCINIEKYKSHKRPKNRVIPKNIDSYRPYYKSYNSKLTNDISISGRTLTYPGYMCVDLMTEMRIHCKNPPKYSLKFFLDRFGLGNKIDMPYLVMFAIYDVMREINNFLGPEVCKASFKVRDAVLKFSGFDHLAKIHKQMSHVVEYCFVDGIRCQDLLIKTNYLADKREMGNLSYVSMEHCVYRANGMKCRNMIASNAHQRKIHFSYASVKNPEAGKYPGAYVFPPEKGLKAPKPTMKEMLELVLDDSYEMPIIARNSFKELNRDDLKEFYTNIIEYGATAEDWPDELYNKSKPAIKWWLDIPMHYPIGGLDYSSLYPSLMMAYNFSPEYMIHSPARALAAKKAGKKLHRVEFEFNGRKIIGWSVRHDYDPSDAKSSPEDGKFGLLPSILLDMFNKRKALKKILKPLAKRMEELENLPEDKFKEAADEYRQVMLDYNYINAKQLALKVFMNTYYGEIGNKNSPLRVLAVAGGITTAGRYNIQLAGARAEELGCKIYYGDTDSIYISMDRKNFYKVDILYYSGQMDKIDYMRELVKLSFAAIKIVQDDVNEYLLANNGTKFLRMAFEELLYPKLLCSKKKYCGIAHEEHFNENPKKIFVRGLDHIKKGKSGLFVDTANKIVWKALDYFNQRSVINIVRDEIKNIYDSADTLPFDSFIKSATYKPNKQNVSVITYVNRLRVEHNIEQVPYQRFRYIVASKYPYKFDVRGRKTDLSVGERMESLEIAKKYNMTPDLSYYMEGGIQGMLARFVCYHPMFQTGGHIDDPEELKEYEEKLIKKVKKFISNECKKFSNICYSSKGPYLKKVFTLVNKSFQTSISDIMTALNLENPAYLMDVNWVLDKKNDTFSIHSGVGEKIIKNKKKECVKTIKNEVKEYCKVTFKNKQPNELLMHKSVIDERIELNNLNVEIKSEEIINKLSGKMHGMKEILQKRNNVIQEHVNRVYNYVADEVDIFTLDHKTFTDTLNDAMVNQGIINSIMDTYTASDYSNLNTFANLCNSLDNINYDFHWNTAVANNLEKEIKKKCKNFRPVEDMSDMFSDRFEYFNSIPV